MRSSPATERGGRRRSHLFDGVTLTLMLGAVVAGFLAVFPHHSILDGLSESAQIDHVSLAWLRIRAHTAGGDPRAELLLAEQASALGRSDEAWEALSRLRALPGPIGAQARTLALELCIRMAREAEPGSRLREVRQAAAREALAASIARPDEGQDLAELATLALELGEPLTAGELHLLLATLSSSSTDELAEAGRLLLAAGEPLRAARAFLDAEASTVDPTRGAELARKALAAFRAANDNPAALSAAALLVARHPRDLALLDAAVAVARSAGAAAQAVAWGRARLACAPNDAAALRRQMELELGAGHVAEAFALAERRAAMDRDSVSARRRLADVAEWAGRMQEALVERTWLARQGGAAELERALRLARQLADPYAIDLLLHLAFDRRPKVDLLAQVLGADEDLGDTPRALATARRFVARVPTEEKGWRLLGALLERTGDLEGALDARDEMGHRFGEHAADVMAAADLLWRQRRPTEALARLRGFADRADLDDLSFFRMLGELAWAQESSKDALFAFERRFQKGDLDAGEIEQLARLLIDAGRRDAAAEIAHAGWQRFHSRRLLLLAMEERATQGAWAALSSLLKEADESEFAGETQYWGHRAEAAVHDGKLREARLAWGHQLTIDPHASEAQVGLLGLAVEDNDRHREEKMLAAWRDDAKADPSLAAMFGLAADRLGHADEALAWLEIGANRRPDEYPLVLAYAEALERDGRAPAARRLRRYLLRRLHHSATILVSSIGLDDDGRELVRSYVTLLREVHGRAAAQAFLAPLLRRGADDPDLRELIVSWALADDDLEYARRWMLRSDRLRKPLPASQQLEIALADGNTTRLAELLSRSAGSLSRSERAEAEEALGDDDQVLDLTRQGLDDPGTPSDERAILRERRSELRERVGSGFQVSSRLETMGPLLTDRHDLRGVLSVTPHVQLSAAASIIDLHADPFRLLLDGHSLEAVPTLGLVFFHRYGSTRLDGGARLRGDGTTPYARLAHAMRWRSIARGGSSLEGSFEAVLGGLPDESAELRSAALRHRLSVALDAGFSQRDYLGIAVALQQYRARDWAYIGQGFHVEVEAGHRLLLGNPLVRLFVRGTVAANQLAAFLPESMVAIVGHGLSVAAVLPPLYGSAGAGIAVGNGEHDDSPLGRRLVYGVEAWAGWIGPPHRFAWEARAGLGLRLFGGTLRLQGFYESDRAVVAGEDNFGGVLSYDILFGGV